ncbi:MAG: AraC family transcriptional regulator [Spirochaetota bacterium]
MGFVVFFIEHSPAGNSCGPHEHNFSEIVYIEGSAGHVCFGERRKRLKDGDIMVHPAHTVHAAGNIRAARHYCLGVKGWETEGLGEGVFKSTPELRERMQSIRHELERKDVFYKALIEAKALEITLLVRRLSGGSDTRAPSVAVEHARDIIDQRFDRKLSITHLADELMATTDVLRLAFKKRYGVTPMRYLVEKRINAAKEMLAGSSKKIGSIAVECGFESEYYFSRLFRQVTGASPRDYRAKAVAVIHSQQ